MHTGHIKYLLMDYLTEHLDESDRDHVRLHLQHCSECHNLYDELKTTHEALQHSQKVLPSSAYYSTILPRVHKRIMGHRESLWSNKIIPSRILLPLALSALFLIFLSRTPSDLSSEHEQTEVLFQAVKDYSPDEVVQAVSTEYASSNALSNPEVVSEGIAEHLRGDHFIREALLKQIESDDIGDMDYDGVLSGLNREQAEQLMSKLSEREML